MLVMWFNHNLQKNTGGNLDRLSHVTIMYNCVNENDPSLSPRNRTDGGPPPTCRLSPRLCGVGRAVRHARRWSARRVVTG